MPLSRRFLWLGLLAVPLAVLAWAVIVGPPGPAASPPFANPPAPVNAGDLARGGADGPFYPSAADVTNGHRVERWEGAAQSCGGSGCHDEIVKQWERSPHRFSGLENPWYRAAFEFAREDIGKAATEAVTQATTQAATQATTQAATQAATQWCAGCHSPSQLLAAKPPQPDPGVDCLSCHAMTSADSSIGQGDYTLDSPNGLPQGLRSLWIRLRPKAHADAWRQSVMVGPASSEACSTCHSGHLEEAMGGDRFRPLFDDYDDWADGPYSGRNRIAIRHDAPTQNCVDCHMPEEAGRKSHDFAASHGALASWRGDKEQLAKIEAFLKTTDVTLDFFAMTEATELDAELEAPSINELETLYAPLNRLPATLRQGESRRVDLVIKASGVGHLFPGGKPDLSESWLEVKGVDEEGNVLFWSGRSESDEPTDLGARHFSLTYFDEKAKRIRHHELWRVRGRALDLRLRSTTPQRVRFRIDIPEDAGKQMTLTARLQYRSLRPDFNAWAFERLGETPPEIPIMTLAETAITLPVIASDAALPAMNTLDEPGDHLQTEDAMRWYDFGVALYDQEDHAGARVAFQNSIELDPTYARAYLERALAVPGLEDPRELLEHALEINPDEGRTRFFIGLLQRTAGENDASLATFKALAKDLPGDRDARREHGNALFTLGRFEEALTEYQATLAIDPLDIRAHRALSQAYRAAGDKERGSHHAEMVKRLSPDDATSRRTDRFLATDPHARPLRKYNPEYLSAPLAPGESP